MITDFEPVMAALFAHLQRAVALPFLADALEGSAVLANVTGFDCLFEGLPVFGPGVPRGATIVSLDPDMSQLTLSAALTATVEAGGFTTGFQTTGRRVRHWGDVKAQPALFLRRTGVTDQAMGHYVISTLECEAWIYCTAGQDPDVAPDTGLGILEQLVRQSFAPDGDYGDPRFTLNGAAYWCRIEGRTDTSPGDQGGQAIARIPIRVTLTGAEMFDPDGVTGGGDLVFTNPDNSAFSDH